MPVEIFETALDAGASDGFIRWRKAHLAEGFYLNASAQHGWVLHKASCGHAMIEGEADMATRQKVCAARTYDLREWLKSRGEGQPHLCLSCKPPVPPVR